MFDPDRNVVLERGSFETDAIPLPEHFPEVPWVALNVGLVYEVFLCWLVSFSTHQVDIVAFGRPPEITWASMIIAGSAGL